MQNAGCENRKYVACCGLACALQAVGFALVLLACAAQPGVQQPIQSQPTPPPASEETETLAVNTSSGVAASGQGRPTVLVVVKTIPRNDIIAVDSSALETEPTETMIMAAFQNHGFPVTTAAEVRKNLQPHQLRRILEGDNRAAADVGLAGAADIVLAGTVQRWRERDARSEAGDTSRVRVRLSVRAITTATGTVAGSTLVEPAGPAEGDAVERLAADSAVAELSSGILAAWHRRTYITEIYADNADYQRVKLLKSSILNLSPEADSVVTVSLAGRRARIRAFSSIPSDKLLVQVYRCITAIPFVVTRFSGNRVNIRFEDTPGECEPQRR